LLEDEDPDFLRRCQFASGALKQERLQLT